MRALALASSLVTLVAGCGGPQLLPTTLFHTPLAIGATPSENDWARLASEGAVAVDTLAALTRVGDAEWASWTTRDDGRGVLMIVARTELGLEAQASGVHLGPAIRPTLRVLPVGRARVIVVESSSAPDSTERDAWLYVVEGQRIVPLVVDDGAMQLAVRTERRTPLDRGWCRASTFTATFEPSGAELVVHEHASVREIAEERPELAARSTYEVERARRLRWSAGALRSDGPSLLDEPTR